MKTNDLLLGFTHKDGNAFSPPERLWLAEAERCRTHMLILGTPGSGKSKFLEWMIRQDIENCRGLCLLDIHGELYEQVKTWLGYNYSLTRDVILLDVSQGEHIKGFNPFRPKRGVSIDVQVDAMVQALMRVWGQANTNETPTLERVLHLVFSAMLVKQIPLHDVFHLINFDQREIRQDIISSISEPIVVSAWQELQNLRSRGQWRDEVLSTENRLFRLARSKTIQRFMGVVDDAFNLDILDVMERGKILLVNLKQSTHLSRDNANTFANLLLNDFFQTAIMFRGKSQLGHEPSPFSLYLDEWQNIVTPDIETILAQARKFGLLLTLANQDLSQIANSFGDSFVNTLLSCCQIKACFGGLNRNDANRMVDEMLAGQIDLDETKHLLEATKFWPRYDRDIVFTSSHSTSESETHTTGNANSMGSGAGVGNGASVGHQWTSEGWIPSPESTSSIATTHSAHAQGSSEGWGHSVGSSEAEAVADIPIFVPEPFKEVISRATYSLEEQRFRWSDRFMNQFPRHCYIKLPGKNTIGMEVPQVQEYYVSPKTLIEYENDIGRLNDAKEAEEVDNLIASRPSLFIEASKAEVPTEPQDEDLFE